MSKDLISSPYYKLRAICKIKKLKTVKNIDYIQNNITCVWPAVLSFFEGETPGPDRKRET